MKDDVFWRILNQKECQDLVELVRLYSDQFYDNTTALELVSYLNQHGIKAEYTTFNSGIGGIGGVAATTYLVQVTAQDKIHAQKLLLDFELQKS